MAGTNQGTHDYPPRPGTGRIVSTARRIGLGDTRPDACLRLDALAGYLQDVADEDAASSPLEASSAWVLRRLALTFDGTPRFRDRLTLSTWASGTGARWAERRTDIERAGSGIVVHASAIWVHVDAASGRPSPLPPVFFTMWGPTAAGRSVRARLTHDAPPAAGDLARERWSLRATDVDIVGHVNNAAYWAAVEEQVARRRFGPITHAEIEFRGGIDPGDDVELAVVEAPGRLMCWFEVGGEVRASASVSSSACPT